MKRYTKLILISILTIYTHITTADWPPISIFVPSGKITAAQMTCDIPENFQDRIKEVYGSLYSNILSIDQLNIEKIRNLYSSLLTYKIHSGVLSIAFDYPQFSSFFKFTPNLVKELIAKEHKLPFVVTYDFEITIELLQKDNTKADKIIYPLSFSHFYGGNPLPELSTESTILEHQQNSTCPGQIMIQRKQATAVSINN